MPADDHIFSNVMLIHVVTFNCMRAKSIYACLYLCLLFVLFVFVFVPDPAALHWEPWPVHEEKEGGLYRGPADEGSGQGGESQEKGLYCLLYIFFLLFTKRNDFVHNILLHSILWKISWVTCTSWSSWVKLTSTS